MTKWTWKEPVTDEASRRRRLDDFMAYKNNLTWQGWAEREADYVVDGPDESWGVPSNIPD